MSTFQALAVVAIGLLPGALYMWSFERQAGRWGIGLSDRVFRFVGGSAVLHACAAPLSYVVWSDHRDAVAQGDRLPWWLWAYVLGIVVVPVTAGTIVGRGTRRGRPWARWFTGPDPAPRAWDHLFQHEADGWIRLRLKSGTWLGGAYADAHGRRSYTAGYPETQDLYLAATVMVDAVTGEFELGDDGRPSVGQGGLLVRWDEVEYLEFIDA